MTRHQAQRLYRRHLAKLSVQGPNVRHHAAPVAFRRCMLAVIEETRTSESCAAEYLVALGLKDPRISAQAFEEKIWFATRHTRHIPQ